MIVPAVSDESRAGGTHGREPAARRLVQWDPTFSEHSYGFRPGRSAHQAVAQAQAYVADGYDVVVDIDLEKFFDRVNQDRLMARVGLSRSLLNLRVADSLFPRRGHLFYATSATAPSGGASASRAATR